MSLKVLKWIYDLGYAAGRRDGYGAGRYRRLREENDEFIEPRPVNVAQEIAEIDELMNTEEEKAA